MKNRIRVLSRILALLLVAPLFFYILLTNIAPFDITHVYSAIDSSDISKMEPASRVKYLAGADVITGDLVYFTNRMLFRYDKAFLKIRYKNNSPVQKINLGYRDQNVWHYASILLDAPVLNNINWQKLGDGPYVFQRISTYKTINDFLSNPPKNEVIGTYDYDKAGLREHVRLSEYKPSKKETVIDTPFRGKTTMYAYLDGEEFRMKFTKRDLNWYADQDVVKINVFKGEDRVFQATIDDDGNDTDNKKVGQSIDLEIKNPGPELPEPGVYKIVIDAPTDSVITKIETNLHKIAFEGPLYPVNNREVYGDLVAKTASTTLTTNANNVSFQTNHRALQTVDVGGQAVKLDQPQKTVTAPGATGAQPINVTMPLSDVVVNGIGYFSFTPEQFFTPTPYKILPIRTAEDLQKVDYVLTNYAGAPKQEGEWKVAEREFDLKDAVIQKGKLSWLISAPGLKENGRTIEIKSIEMTLTKKGWFE